MHKSFDKTTSSTGTYSEIDNYYPEVLLFLRKEDNKYLYILQMIIFLELKK